MQSFGLEVLSVAAEVDASASNYSSIDFYASHPHVYWLVCGHCSAARPLYILWRRPSACINLSVIIAGDTREKAAAATLADAASVISWSPKIFDLNNRPGDPTGEVELAKRV